MDRGAHINNAFTRTKALLGIKGSERDGVLLFVVETIEDMILAYINHETLPRPLWNILPVMAVSYYKSAGFGSTEATTGPVTSVRRGDVTTSFATTPGASGAAQTFNLGADGGDFFGWRTTLDEYRKLRW